MMFYIRNNIETQWYNLNETIVNVVAPYVFSLLYNHGLHNEQLCLLSNSLIKYLIFAFSSTLYFFIYIYKIRTI